METKKTNPEMNRDDMQRPDRAKSDELGRTNTGTRSSKPSPREQPAKAVHVEKGTDENRFGKSRESSGSKASTPNRGSESTKKSSAEDLDEDEEM
jgi:hypothetical protein